jgi:hypothetical protein
MPTTQIPDLPPILSIDGDELVPARDALGDVKITLDQVASFVKGELTPAETLAKVVAANPQVNGLNANLLQGLASTFFRNASNLNSGVVPDAQLPIGDHSWNWTSGGTYPAAGSLEGYIKFPRFLFGINIMLQWGWTNFVPANTDLSISFNQPFSQGFSSENKPFVIVVPENRGSEWNGSVSSPPNPSQNVELTMSVYHTTLTNFKCSSTRIGGALNDYVRGNWFAIGYYSD